MQKFDTIYKRTTAGKVQIWYQEINDEGNGFRSTSGQEDGKKVTSEWTIVKGKNIGRANETTPQEQTLSEVSSHYDRKLESSYVRDIEDIDNVTKLRFDPMTAKTFGKHVMMEDLTWDNVWSQPKLDGVRGILYQDRLMSRADKPLISCPHILERMQSVFDALGHDAIFDGELYAHKLHNDFSKIISLVKKKKPTADQIAESAEKVQYWIYDLPSHPGTFSERMAALESVAYLFPGCVKLVTSTFVVREENLDEIYEGYLEDGMEGQMVRIDNKPYEHKRSKSLLKRKIFDDHEFEIVAIEEGKGNRSGMAGMIHCVTTGNEPADRTGTKPVAGSVFSTGIIGDYDYCRELLANKEQYIGLQATVEFFGYTTTEEPKPRFGKTKVIHKTDRI